MPALAPFVQTLAPFVQTRWGRVALAPPVPRAVALDPIFALPRPIIVNGRKGF